MACALRRSAPLVLSACSLAIAAICTSVRAEEPAHSAALDEAIIRSAARHGVPESLVRRVVMRESKYNPHARNHSFWGLMQISYPTAKSMGFRGTPEELLNPVTNLRYAVPYLANAFVIAGKHQDAAVRLYAHGYYEAAKRRGLLSALRTADSTPVKDVPEEEVAVALPPQPEQDTGLFGALFGPQQMPRDAQTEQAVYAAAPPAPAAAPVQEAAPAQETAQAAAAAPSSGHDGDEVAMAPDRQGNLQPPKSWRRDGGTTVIARGEQSVEQVAAYSRSTEAAESHGRGRHHSHKSTVFASLDAPPAGAQAYAADAGGQDPRLMQAESQAAIAQATAGQPVQPVAGQAPGDPQQAAAAQPATPAPQAAADDAPVQKSRRRHVAHRGHHHGEDAPAPAVAAAEPQSSAPAQAPAQAADATPGQQQPGVADMAQAAAQQLPADASGQPAAAAAEPGAPQAQPQQAAADDSGEASPPHRHKHRSRHVAHAHKATDVAVQAPSDGEPQPSEFQPK